MEKRNAPEKLWTLNFTLLWQGQLVSILGDVVYAIALGFWILAKTGSTALMGGLMAASVFPRILASPIAGVVVDRNDRRRLLILMDIIRGMAVLLVAFAGFSGLLEVWMVFAAGILIGLCGAFFTPSVNSVIPDITGKTRVVQANSVFAMLQTGGNIVGNSAGGALFQAFGAPLLFLFNGASYLFSAASLLFARFPRVSLDREKPHFWADLRNGFSFIWKLRGLRALIILAGVLNFFANMSIMLFLPFFQKSSEMGPVKYGAAMAFFMGGMFLGMAGTAIVKVPAAKRFFWFVLCGLVSMPLMILFPHVGSFAAMLAMLGVSGMTSAVINVFIMSVMQLTVPQEMRGKVFALMGMLLQGLTPIAFALGGVVAEFVPVPTLISAGFGVAVVVSLPLVFLRSFRRFINFDPEKDTVDSVR